MKLLFYRMICIAALTVIFPLTLSAASYGSIDKPVKRVITASASLFQDTVSAKRKPAKAREEANNVPQEVRDERLREAQGRAIKQVPRSIPKLKPQPVTDRIKITRPSPKKEAGARRF